MELQKRYSMWPPCSCGCYPTSLPYLFPLLNHSLDWSSPQKPFCPSALFPPSCCGHPSAVPVVSEQAKADNPRWGLFIWHSQSLLWGPSFLKNSYLSFLCITWVLQQLSQPEASSLRNPTSQTIWWGSETLSPAFSQSGFDTLNLCPSGFSTPASVLMEWSDCWLLFLTLDWDPLCPGFQKSPAFNQYMCLKSLPCARYRARYEGYTEVPPL